MPAIFFFFLKTTSTRDRPDASRARGEPPSSFLLGGLGLWDESLGRSSRQTSMTGQQPWRSGDSTLLGQPFLAHEDVDVGDSTEDTGQIATLLHTLSSISASGIKSPSSRRARAQCPLVLPDIPEKISLEDWSIKACYIEDMVYPSPRNCSYLTSSCTAAFMEPSRCAADSESSLLLSSLTESSSIGSLPLDQSDAYRKVVRSLTPTGAGLQCRRNENPDVLVVMGTAKFPCHRAVLSMHSQYFQRILGVNPRSQKLELQGVSSEAFRVLLDYMYSGRLHITCQNVGKLYVTASILRVPRVKHKASGHLDAVLGFCPIARTIHSVRGSLPPQILTKSPYDPKHAVYVYVTARKYGLQSVGKRALRLLQHRLEETVTCKPFLDLDLPQVCELLSGNSVGARGEMVIFLAALHWLNHNYLEHEEHVLRVLQCVRFSTMSSEELLRCLHPPLLPGIMEAPEVLAHIHAAICYKTAVELDQQHLFEQRAEKPRYFKLDGPITLWLVGALASHMATRLRNPHDSDCAHADQPVLSLPPAAMLEAMVDQRANLDMMPDSPALPASPASPPLDWGDSMEPAFAPSPPRPPNPPSPQPTRVAPRAKPAVGRVAAFEAMLAPETNARVAALEREELRKEELHQLQVQLLRGQQQRIELELELLQLDKRIKLQQLLALEAKTQE
ncbi:hypothetical protein ISCGN_028251 [Ixodes scapularis]